MKSFEQSTLNLSENENGNAPPDFGFEELSVNYPSHLLKDLLYEDDNIIELFF